MTEENSSNPQTNPELLSKIREWVATHTDEIHGLLRELVSIPSPSGKEQQISAKVHELYKSAGFSPQKCFFERAQMSDHPAYIQSTDMGAPESYADRPNIIITIPGSGNGASLILNAHMDTVSVENEKDWIHPPYAGEIIEDKMYGRGAADNKSGVVIAYYCAKMFHELGIQLGGNLIIHNTIEEEVGGNGTLQCIMAGNKADAAIELDNVGYGLIVAASRGIHMFDLTLTGQPMMTEYLWEHPNVLEQGTHLVELLRQFNISRNIIHNHPYYEMYPPHIPKLTVAVTAIHAGNFLTTVPGQITLQGLCECLPGTKLSAMRREFADFIKKTVLTDPKLKDVKYKLKWFGFRIDPSEIPADSPIINALNAAHKDVVGTDGQVVGVGGCDLHLYINDAKIPAIMFGPASGNGHGVDEFIDLKSLKDCLCIVAETIIRFCGLAK